NRLCTISVESTATARSCPVKRSGKPSLENESLINLQVVRADLSKLSDHLFVLRDRTLCFLDERETGTVTSRCSRRDLQTIAQLLPRRDSWDTPLFDQQKASIKARYNLSGTQFCKALNVIQGNREMKATL